MTIEELKNNGWKDESGNLWNDPNETEWVYYDFDREFRKTSAYIYKLPLWFVGETKRVEGSRTPRYVTETYCMLTALKMELELHGRTLEEYYARFILNLTELPECRNPSCHNKVHVRDGKLSHGLTDFCSHRCYCKHLMARRERDKHRKKVGLIYVFYLARTYDNRLKIGITSHTIKTRSYVQFYNAVVEECRYATIHKVFESDNITIADLEFYIKSQFDYCEYLPWYRLRDVINLIKEFKKSGLKFSEKWT